MKLQFFSTDIPKINKYQIPLKSVQWEPSCSMQADGRGEQTDATVAFRISSKST
jgi:hypothetical protein